MILRILLLAQILTFPLSAYQSVREPESTSRCFGGCNSCSQQPSLAELLQSIQLVLNNGILFLPQLQPQLIQLVQNIVTEGGIGVVGPQGPAGPQGPSGGVLEFADFFALMPGDNAATIGIGADVNFPQDGPTSAGGVIARTGPNTFNLAEIGVYEVLFQVSVTEPGQLVLTLDSGGGPVVLSYTVAGRATGTSQIVGMALVQTTVVNSVLTVRNNSSAAALTITPLAGGTAPVSAHLIITRIQ